MNFHAKIGIYLFKKMKIYCIMKIYGKVVTT